MENSDNIFVIATYNNEVCTLSQTCYNDLQNAHNAVRKEVENLKQSKWFNLNGFEVKTNYSGYFYAENQLNETIRICVFQLNLETNIENNLKKVV